MSGRSSLSSTQRPLPATICPKAQLHNKARPAREDSAILPSIPSRNNSHTPGTLGSLEAIGDINSEPSLLSHRLRECPIGEELEVDCVKHNAAVQVLAQRRDVGCLRA